MMRSYLELILHYEKVHKKNRQISVLCIILAVCLVTAVFSMADMGVQAQKNYFIKTNGGYHISLREVSQQTAGQIGSRDDVATAGWVYQGTAGTLQEKTVSFAGADEAVFAGLTEMNMTDGTYPVQDNEILLNNSAMQQLGLSVGDTVSVAVPGGAKKDFRITGILEDMGTLLKADVYGMVLTENGFRAIADGNAYDGTTYRIQFKNGVNIQKSIHEIKKTYGLKEGQLSENTALLGLMGQSESGIMQSLYLVAAVLVLLVLTAGTVMISASFNTNVLERTQLYGLLRCLGASEKQVKHFVILQGLRQSMAGVPLGLLIGELITWAACLLLKSVSGQRFSEIPLFQFSVVGITAGILTGFLIVLLASLSPAKKAARVSPVTAVSGSMRLVHNKRTVNTKFFRVETGMGIFHALSGRKNFFLMICSFAVSIVLFLSFQVLVVFLQEGMPALEASASDIAITENGIPLDFSLNDKIQSVSGVSKVYGRMEQADVFISYGEKNGTVTLVSYEKNQLEWAKDKLLAGSSNTVQTKQDSVLVSHQENADWKVGGSIVIHTPKGERTVRIAGILSETFASSGAGTDGYIVCSEPAFASLAEKNGYTSIDIQLADTATDETVSAIRSLITSDCNISDKRLTNFESQSSYYTGAVFIYGFLIIIALITVFNIFNSMNAGVSSRIKLYGIMRSIGMSAKQLYKMAAAEAAAYAVSGCIAGCIIGLPFNKWMYQYLITDKWGTTWQLPLSSLAMIVLLCLVSAAVAILRPIKQINSLSIVDTIKSQQ